MGDIFSFKKKYPITNEKKMLVSLKAPTSGIGAFVNPQITIAYITYDKVPPIQNIYFPSLNTFLKTMSFFFSLSTNAKKKQQQ